MVNYLLWLIRGIKEHDMLHKNTEVQLKDKVVMH